MPITKTSIGTLKHTTEEVILPDQLFLLEELKGKTISRAWSFIAHGDSNRRVAIVFDDKTFVLFDVELNYDDDCRNWSMECSFIPHFRDLTYLSLMSQTEARERESRQRNQDEKEQRAHRRRQYEKLKKEFEGE